MFLFVLAKLLPERHNPYGNSLDFKLKIYERKKMKRDSDPCPMLYDEQLFKLFGLPFKQLDFLMRYLLINHFDNILIAKVH